MNKDWQIKCMSEEIERKNALLQEALEQLKAVEWDVNIGTIARIEAELNTEAEAE